MSFTKAISQNPVASFAVGTFAIQLTVLLSCLALRSAYLSNQQIAPTVSSSVPMSAGADPEPVGPVAQNAEPAELATSSSASVLPEVAPEIKQLEPVAPPAVESQARIVTHVVKAGDNFTRIWTAHGGTVSGAILAGKSVDKAGITGTALRLGEKITLTLGASGDVIELKRKLKDGRILTIEGSSKSGYKASVSELKVIEKERVASGSITRSFAQAASDQDVPYTVINELVDIFGGQIEFSRQVQAGDSFSVIYSERSTEEGDELEPAAVRAASFRVNGRNYAAVRHVAQDGSVRYFDESGEPLGNFFLRYPVQFTRISSVFSTARFHPVLGVNRPHNGVDFAAPIGTPVRAVADGVVSTAGYIGDAGNMVKISHGERYATAYLHLSKIAKGLRNGSRVKRGDIIGAVGMSGLASGPHLHFSFYDRGMYVNPLQIKLPQMPQRGEGIPAGYLRATLDLLSEQHQKIQLAAVAELANPKA